VKKKERTIIIQEIGCARKRKWAEKTFFSNRKTWKVLIIEIID